MTSHDLLPVVAAHDPAACPVCAGDDVQVFLELRQVPVHCNVLWSSAAAAQQAPRGDIRLAFCPTCSHVFNVSFEPALTEYTQRYENSLYFSARFQSYADALAERLVERHALRGKHIVEIGCGRGDFLRQLAKIGGNTGVGFDTSYVPDPRLDTPESPVRFVLGFYDESNAEPSADLLVSRHVLEHISHPVAFLRGIRRTIPAGRRPVVFFEMPNVLYTLRDMGIWDIIYEHCSYFSPGSLTYAFQAAGFEVTRLTEEFAGQFLAIEAVPASEAGPAPRAWSGFEMMERDVAAFTENFRRKVAGWRQTLEDLAREERRVVVWGAGSKGVTFMNVFRDGSPIRSVVDINPRKQGMFVSGTGTPIVGPDALRSYRPEAVIVMNPIYASEIRQFLIGLGISAELMFA